jgi:hypothetical protein
MAALALLAAGCGKSVGGPDGLNRFSQLNDPFFPGFPSGVTGEPGTSGGSGTSGTSGVTGESGVSGDSGTSGASGATGETGCTGGTGDTQPPVNDYCQDSTKIAICHIPYGKPEQKLTICISPAGAEKGHGLGPDAQGTAHGGDYLGPCLE